MHTFVLSVVCDDTFASSAGRGVSFVGISGACVMHHLDGPFVERGYVVNFIKSLYN